MSELIFDECMNDVRHNFNCLHIAPENTEQNNLY